MRTATRSQMPISSAAKKATSSGSASAGTSRVNRQRSNWSTSGKQKNLIGSDNLASIATVAVVTSEKSMSSFQKKYQSTSASKQHQVKQQQQQQQQQVASGPSKYKSIKHISAPSSAATTSAASLVDLLKDRKISISNDLPYCDHHKHQLTHRQVDNISTDIDLEDDDDDDDDDNNDDDAGHMQPTSINIGGQLVLTSGKQPNSIGSIMDLSKEMHHQSSQGVLGGEIGSGKSYLASNSQYQITKNNKLCNQQQQSRLSLNQPSTTTNSTAHLHSLSELTGGSSNNNCATHPLSIKQNVNLKYVKTLLIVLMGIDLLITVLVHQFATQDQISIWLTSIKMRFSMLNLILSATWFIVLAGAILFDILFILIIGCLVDISSLALLVVLSIVHFTQRIDYNPVNLTSLLGLLFGIIILHVYMLVMTTLTIYLMLAVKRRRAASSRR